jgi:hypothetical protein
MSSQPPDRSHINTNIPQQCGIRLLYILSYHRDANGIAWHGALFAAQVVIPQGPTGGVASGVGLDRPGVGSGLLLGAFAC